MVVIHERVFHHHGIDLVAVLPGIEQDVREDHGLPGLSACHLRESYPLHFCRYIRIKVLADALNIFKSPAFFLNFAGLLSHFAVSG